jgi:glycosyltransferase involved in cell wall biosynthesis
VKVLQVHNHYRQAGGEDAVVSAEAALLRSAGHEVFEYEVDNPHGSLTAARTLALSAWNPWAARDVRVFAGIHRPDVAHVHNTWYALSPSVIHALKEAGLPVVMTLHNYRLMCTNGLLFRDGHPCRDCVGTNPWHGVLHRCYRGSAVASAAAATTIAINQARGTWARDVDLLLVLSEFAKSQFVAGGIPNSKLRVKPNFVDDPGPRARPPSESGTLLYVGRLSPEKGVDRLIEMSGALNRAGLKLLIVGDGPMQRALAAGETEVVRLLGPLPADDVARLMVEARALLFPSIWYEGQPVVILQAFAAGLPVLGSDLGGIAELLAPLGREWLVESPLRAESWDMAIAGLLDDDRVDKAGRVARETFEARFHPDAALSLLEVTYRSII